MPIKRPEAAHTSLPAVAVPTVAAPAVAAAVATPTAAKPAKYAPIPVLSKADLQLVNRFTGGFTPTIRAEIRQAGGADKWFEKQLSGKAPDTFYEKSAKWWPSNTASLQTLVKRDQNGTEGIWQAVANYERWGLVRRIHSERQVLETMTSFWEHHLHVPADADGAQYFRASYGKTLRKLALTSFTQILTAAITHPAMGCFLDNADSTKEHPNENLGRELLELHTVGRESGYTEDDVKASARILTGYRVYLWTKHWRAEYDKRSHATGPVRVLGFRHKNKAADGRPVTRAYLKYLAHHPATARHLARKLAIRFVADNPPQRLVDTLAAVYLKHDTKIVPVLRALVGSDEFRTASHPKVRTPEEDVVASYRAIGATFSSPRKDNAAANAILWNTTDLGLRPYGWPRPDGRPDDAASWTSVSRMLSSFGFHHNLAGGWWPTEAVRYVQPIDRLPAKKLRFDELVDHLSRTILGRPATDTLVAAACQAVDCARAEKITAKHEVIRWKMTWLLQVMLDNPTHMTR